MRRHRGGRKRDKISHDIPSHQPSPPTSPVQWQPGYDSLCLIFSHATWRSFSWNPYESQCAPAKPDRASLRDKNISGNFPLFTEFRNTGRCPSATQLTSCVLTWENVRGEGRGWFRWNHFINHPAAAVRGRVVKFRTTIIYSWCRNSVEFSQPEHCRTVKCQLPKSLVTPFYLSGRLSVFILFPEARGGEIWNVDLSDLNNIINTTLLPASLTIKL